MFTVADPGVGGPRGPCPPPLPSKNKPKKDDRRMRRPIFHVSWSPLRSFWIRYWFNMLDIFYAMPAVVFYTTQIFL